MTNITLRRVGDRGSGAFARKAIAEGVSIGEFTGRIRPSNPHAPLSETYYHSLIVIGPDPNSRTTVQVDATRTGFVTRFLNHSFVPNCRILEARKGRERILHFETNYM
jgi:SET domain-containing protein